MRNHLFGFGLAGLGLLGSVFDSVQEPSRNSPGRPASGSLRVVQTACCPEIPAVPRVRRTKTAIAQLAESVLGRICRVIGGGTFSRSSPFGYWFEDVRALGFLRPPWLWLTIGFSALDDPKCNRLTAVQRRGRRDALYYPLRMKARCRR